MSLDPGDLRITFFCCENPKAEHAHTSYSSAAVLLNFFLAVMACFWVTVPRKRQHVTKHHLAVGLNNKLGKLIWRQAGTCVAMWSQSTVATSPNVPLQRCHAASTVRTRARWNSWAPKKQTDSNVANGPRRTISKPKFWIFFPAVGVKAAVTKLNRTLPYIEIPKMSTMLSLGGLVLSIRPKIG